ncbi:class I SAM-dependent methyltransferase [Mucilaginibacter sp.]|uniref:class I SAM-dependent methyltransferase n=1 Tax=Mucilaginibacter sp. TaxID=1882438 RepID=UPI002614EA23|nr:class I SAM-dependent methyltransferase [Mucilaginibacter sp.]
MNSCKICNTGLLESTFNVREMMLGMRDEFAYAQCPSCQTIQIIDMPTHIESYYPGYYYSFQHTIPPLVPLPFIKRWFESFRIKKKYRKSKMDIFNYLKPLGTLPSQKILDIGCGKGKLICEMYNLGFTNIQGVDKYVHQEYDYGHGVKVFRKDLCELRPDSYDLLMMHHVFEHMDDPYTEFSKSYNLLKKGGYLLVRIPVVGKAWEIYQQNWVQLDAPRHFFLHTTKSIQLLADKTGFILEDVNYDSTAFQFWGSELYKRDIALVKPDTKEYVTAKDFFSADEIAGYEISAEELNSQNQGDQAIFYLRKG